MLIQCVIRSPIHLAGESGKWRRKPELTASKCTDMPGYQLRGAFREISVPGKSASAVAVEE